MEQLLAVDVVRATPPPPLSRPITPRPPRAAGRALPQRFGRYTLFSHIGRGGMADIYLATATTDLGASRLVVIKEVLPELAHSTHFADMLASEAKLAARLDHTNVVKVEDLGRDGALYIAMEYVEGVDLREMLRRCAKAKIPVPVEFSLRVVIEALKALSYAHRFKDDRGTRLAIVHRDVSPSNILLSFEGEVKLCDFGIARAHAFAEALSDEAIQGKAGYMSPEQAMGEPLDARADVFAAGIVLWELLSGRRLYKAKAGERLLDVARRAEIPALQTRGLPYEEEIVALVARALARKPSDRFTTAAGMLEALEDYAAKARLVASPLRFGAWLAEHFAQEIIDPRRAGERAIRALALGPAATLEPLEPTTPSTFVVVERAPEEAPESTCDDPPPALASDVETERPPVVAKRRSRNPGERQKSRELALRPSPPRGRHAGWLALGAAVFLMTLGTAWHVFAGY